MAFENTTNSSSEASSLFVKCLGIYHLTAAPTGKILATYVLVMVVLSFLSILTSFGNGLVIYVYLKQKSLQTSNFYLLICLAFLDFFTGILLEPLYIVRLLSEINGFTSCVYILIMRRSFEFLRPVSFITLALSTIERYLAFFKPVIHRRFVTKKYLLRTVLLSWFFWLLVIFIRSLFPGITFAFYFVFTFVAFSLFAVNIGMYYKIGKLARFHSKCIRPTVNYSNAGISTKVPTIKIDTKEVIPRPKEIMVKPTRSNTEQDALDNARKQDGVEVDETSKSSVESRTDNTAGKQGRLKAKRTLRSSVEKRERYVTRTVLYIVVILAVCYLPFLVMLVYISLQRDLDANSLFIYVPIADTIALFNAFINPFIYCLRNRKMRTAVQACWRRNETSGGSRVEMEE